MAIRRASSTETSRMPHLLEPEHARETCGRALELRAEVPAHARLGVEGTNVEDSRGAIRLEVGAADDAVAGEQRQHVVAVRAFVLALVDLDHVAKAEDALEQRAIPDEVVERAEEDGWRWVAVELGFGVDVERRASVVGLHLAQEPFVHEPEDVLVEARASALEPPMLANRRLSQGAAGADGEKREPAQGLGLGGGRLVEDRARNHALGEV